MEHGSLWTELLGRAGLHAPDEIVMVTLVFAILVAIALIGTRRLSVQSPSNGQQLLEVAVGGFVKLIEDTIPHHGRKHVAVIGTFGAFILTSNLLGLVPSFTTPTSHYSVTLPLALLSFVYYNQAAIRTVGVGHVLKHMAGPMLLLAPLIFPIELVGNCARVLSLSMRLFGNMYGEHSASGVFYGFFGGFLVPLPMLALGVFGAALQTFIFVLLSMLYIALATEGEH